MSPKITRDNYEILLQGLEKESFHIAWYSDVIYLFSCGFIIPVGDASWSLTLKGLWVIFVWNVSHE